MRAVVICPSNPFISIEPILAVPGMRAALAGCGAPVVAVSPIVGGRAVKGPTAKMMQELGLPVSAASAAARYGDLLAGYVVDTADAEGVRAKVHVAPTLMTTLEDRERAGPHRPRLCRFARREPHRHLGDRARSRSWTAPSSVSRPCSRRPSAGR